MTKFARFSINKSIKYGIVKEDVIQEINNPPYQDYHITKNTYDLSNVSFGNPYLQFFSFSSLNVL